MRLTKYQYNRLQADIGGLTTLYAIIKAEKNKEKEPKLRVRFRFLLAEKMGFEPMHHVYLRSTPLAGEPLEPLGYFSNCAAERSRLDYDNTKIGNSQSLLATRNEKFWFVFAAAARLEDIKIFLRFLTTTVTST